MGEKMLSYKNIAKDFGETAVQQMKSYSKKCLQQCKQKNRRIYLLRCRDDNVIPTFLKLKTKHIMFNCRDLERRFGECILKNFTQNTLSLLITDTVKNLHILQSNITQITNFLKTLLPQQIFNNFICHESEKMEIIFQKLKQKNINKFNRLNNKGNINSKINSSWIENLTDVDIPEYVNEVLSLGPNFAIPLESPEDIPIPDIISNIEISLINLNTDVKDDLRSTCCNIITNHKNNFNKTNSNKKEQKIFLNKINKTKSFLKQNNNLKILKPDKSNKTVIMFENDYNKKINDLLKDGNTYKELKTDPTNIYQKNNNNLICRWENLMYISPNTAKYLKIQNAQPPRIYGLPKLHKKGIPLRPIVSCIQSPFEKLSKFLKNILQNIVNQNNYYIKDSVDFKNKIKNVTLPNDYTLISLDVVSLYTNVPLNLAREIIIKKWNKINKYTDIPLDEFLEAVELTLKSTYFMYGDRFYKQIEGCAMGASISSVIAQLVMEDLEENVLGNVNFHIPFFYRYVDDCIAAIPSNKTQDILDQFNSYHNKLNFTIEIEKQHKISFLDLTLHHENNCIKTEWFTKETWSSRYVNFNSQHPISQKKSVIIGLADRAVKLSSPEYREHAIEKAKEALKLNNYPKKLIDTIFKKRIHLFYNQPKSKLKKNNYLSLPYIPGLSEKISNTFKKHDITVAHKGYNLLKRNFSNLKSKIPKNKKSHIVYQIPCSNCDGVYIGQTSQYLKNRLNGHKYDKKNKTALTSHMTEKNHTFNYNNVKILRTENNTKKRELYEMIEIQRNSKSINSKTDTKHLSKIYHNIIK